MRILLIHQIFVTPHEGGGTRHFEMCRYLAEKGYEVIVIASEIDYLSGKKRDKNYEILDGVHIHYARASSDVHKSIFHRAWNFFSFSYHAYRLASTMGKFDLIWGTSPPLFQAWSASRIAKKQKKPFIFEVRDLWIDFARELKIIKNPFLFRFFKSVEKMIYQKADFIIVNSPGFIPHIKKITGNKKIDVFPNGVEVTNFLKTNHLKTAAFIEKFDLKGKFIVTYAGNIGLANDIENILEAAQILKNDYPNIIFIFLGGGINIEKYKKYIQSAELTNVKFIPMQPKKEMPYILNASDVCLATLKAIPLFKTNYPNKVFDYMAAAKPTVLAIDGATREVIEKANGGIYVEPGNAKTLSEAILKYFEDRNLAKSHGENARKYVTINFDRKLITEKFAQYLSKII